MKPGPLIWKRLPADLETMAAKAHRGAALISIKQLCDLAARVAVGQGFCELGLMLVDPPNDGVRIGAI